MGIIRKQNDEVFWLGADVGQTESISHIPTQITEYKGINAPLTNWEKSFFEGYLLRCGQVKRYWFYLRLYFRAVQIKYKWVYFQNAKTSCSPYTNTNYILLNSQKQKIDSNGNVLSDDDTTSFSAGCRCNLPQGKYYCRIIRSDMIELGDDIEFNVSSTQRIDLIVDPKLVKMEYKSNGITEEVAYSIDESKTEYTKEYDDGFTKEQPYNLSIELDNSVKSVVFNYDISDVTLNDVSLRDMFSFKWEVGISTLGGWFLSIFDYNEYCYTIEDNQYIPIEDPKEVSNPKQEFTYCLKEYALTSDALTPVVKGLLNCHCKFDDTHYVGVIHNCILNSAKLIYNVEYSTLDYIWHTGIGVQWQIGYTRQWVTKKGEVYNYYFDKYQVSTVKNIHPKVTRSALSCLKPSETYKERRVLFDGTINDTEAESPSEINEVETNEEFMVYESDFDNIFTWIYEKVGDILKAQGYTNVNTQSCNRYPYYQTSDGIIEAYSKNWITRIDDKNNAEITNDSSIVSGFIASPIIYDEIRKGYEKYFE